ncbi:hypothetical protein OFEAOIEE_LOCUS3395 [Methylorubrum extorquens]
MSQAVAASVADRTMGLTYAIAARHAIKPKFDQADARSMSGSRRSISST